MQAVRAYDVRDPYEPREVAYYVPPAPQARRPARFRSTMCSVDDRGVVFAVDSMPEACTSWR